MTEQKPISCACGARGTIQFVQTPEPLLTGCLVLIGDKVICSKCGSIKTNVHALADKAQD